MTEKCNINADVIRRLLRALEKYTCIGANVVGSFESNGSLYNIRLTRRNFNPDHSNIAFNIQMSIEMPTSSGPMFIEVGEFSSMHPQYGLDFSPQIRADKYWLTWSSAKLYNPRNVNVSVVPIKSHNFRMKFQLCGGSTEELGDDFEVQSFQHNISCDDSDVIDQEYLQECVNLALSEIARTSSTEDEGVISCVDFMPHEIKMSQFVAPVQIPYDIIVQEIEKYVQSTSESC